VKVKTFKNPSHLWLPMPEPSKEIWQISMKICRNLATRIPKNKIMYIAILKTNLARKKKNMLVVMAKSSCNFGIFN
jgi:hypothetical protein